MTLSVNHLVQASGAGNSITTASFTPTPGSRIMVFVGTKRNGALPTAVTGLTDSLGGSWSYWATAPYDPGTDPRQRIDTFARSGTSPTGAMTITAATTSADFIMITVEEVVSSGGFPPVNNQTANGTSATGDPSDTLSPAPNSSDEVNLTCFMGHGSSTVTAPTGNTELVQFAMAGGANGQVQVVYDPVPTATTTTYSTANTYAIAQSLTAREALAGYEMFNDAAGTGITAAGWTSRFDLTNVVYDETSSGYLTATVSSAAARHLLTMDGAATPTDVEILVKVRNNATPVNGSPSASVWVRGSGANAGAAQGYRFGFIMSAGGVAQIAVAKYVAGTASGVGTDTAYSWTTGQWHWLRAKIKGTTLNLKAWADGSAESSATAVPQITDSSVSGAGWIGIFNFIVGSADCDYFSYATAGGTALGPLNISASQTLFVAQSAALLGTTGTSIGGIPIGTAGTGIYSGLKLVWGDDFNSEPLPWNLRPNIAANVSGNVDGSWGNVTPHTASRNFGITEAELYFDSSYRGARHQRTTDFGSTTDTTSVTTSVLSLTGSARPAGIDNDVPYIFNSGYRDSPDTQGRPRQISGGLSSHPQFHLGADGDWLVEAKVQLTAGSIHGYWPGFWTSTYNWPDYGEVDILEAWHPTLRQSNVTLHINDSDGASDNPNTLVTDRTVTTGRMVQVAVSKVGNTLTYYDDFASAGTMASVATYTDSNRVGTRLKGAHRIMAQLAVATFGTTYNAAEWPKSFQVDWIRVWTPSSGANNTAPTILTEVNTTPGGSWSSTFPAAATLYGFTPSIEEIYGVWDNEDGPGWLTRSGPPARPGGMTVDTTGRTVTGTVPSTEGGRVGLIFLGTQTTGGPAAVAYQYWNVAPAAQPSLFHDCYAAIGEAFSRTVAFTDFHSGNLGPHTYTVTKTSGGTDLTISGNGTGTVTITGTIATTQVSVLNIACTNVLGQVTNVSRNIDAQALLIHYNFRQGVYRYNGVNYASFAAALTGSSSTFVAPLLNVSTEGSTYVEDLNGNLTVVSAANQARIGGKGLVYEDAITNLSAHSTTFETHTLNAVTIEQDTQVAPSGSTSADRIVETTANAAHTMGGTDAVTFTAGQKYILSVYFKRATARYIQIAGSTLAWGTDFYANFDLGRMIVTAQGAGVAQARITTAPFLGKGWFRCSIGGTATTTTSAAAAVFICHIDSSTALRAPTYAGSTSTFIYAWGSMVEQVSDATRNPSSFLANNKATGSLTKVADAWTQAIPATVTTLLARLEDDTIVNLTVTPSSSYAVPPSSFNGKAIREITGIAASTAIQPLIGTYYQQGTTINVSVMSNFMGYDIPLAFEFVTYSSKTALTSSFSALSTFWKNNGRPSAGSQRVYFSLAFGSTDGNPYHPTTPTNGTWNQKDIADGVNDTELAAMATQLVNDGHANALIRLAWEMNGTWYPWGSTTLADYRYNAATNTANFIAAWRNVVNVFRAAGNAAANAISAGTTQHFEFVWAPTITFQAQATELYYPGDAYVDWIAPDVYGQQFNSVNMTPQQIWDNEIMGYDNYHSAGISPGGKPYIPRAFNAAAISYGVRWFINECLRGQKKFGIAETGCGFRDDHHGFGDQDIFWQKIGELISEYGPATGAILGAWDIEPGDYYGVFSKAANSPLYGPPIKWYHQKDHTAWSFKHYFGVIFGIGSDLSTSGFVTNAPTGFAVNVQPGYGTAGNIVIPQGTPDNALVAIATVSAGEQVWLLDAGQSDLTSDTGNPGTSPNGGDQITVVSQGLLGGVGPSGSPVGGLINVKSGKGSSLSSGKKQRFGVRNARGGQNLDVNVSVVTPTAGTAKGWDIFDGTGGVAPYSFITGWTGRWVTSSNLTSGGVVWSEEVTAPGFARATTSGNFRYGLQATPVGVYADIDIACSVRVVPTSAFNNAGVAYAVGGVVARGSGGNGSEGGYFAGLRVETDGTRQFVLRKYINSAITNLLLVPYAWVPNTFYEVRLQVTGTTIRAKVWLATDPEPGTWAIDTIDSSITAAGWTGIMAGYWQTGGATVEFDYFGWDTIAVGTTSNPVLPTSGIPQLSASQAITVTQSAFLTGGTVAGRALSASQAIVISQTVNVTGGTFQTRLLSGGTQSIAVTQSNFLQLGQIPAKDIRREVGGLAPQSIVEMFEYDELGIGGTEIVRWHSGTTLMDQPITWQGKLYNPMPIAANGFQLQLQGTLPRPTLTISNIGGVIGAHLRSIGDGVGAKVTRRRTLAKYMDAVNFVAGNSNADPNAHFPDEIFFIARKSSENPIFIELELAVSYDVIGVQLPRRQVIAGTCLWVYRSADCGYAGPPVQDINGNATSNPAKDACRKTLSACKARFGVNGVLNTSTFPASSLIGGA